jgi:hypothetical protein
MKNVTITLDEETIDWARIHAAEHRVSVSRFIGDLLRERMRHSREYDEAMRRFLSKGPYKIKGPRQRYPKREELYDRGRLR